MSPDLAQLKPVVAALRHSALLQNIPLRQLTALAEAATEVQVSQGDVVYDAGVDADAFYVVRSGRLQDFGRDATGKPLLRRQLRPGDTFGETAVVLAQPTRSRVIANEATVLARIAAADLHKAMANSAAVRRAIHAAAHPEVEALATALTQHDADNADLVAIEGPDGWPATALIQALAEALTLNHRDRVAIVHVATATRNPSALPKPSADGVVHLQVGPDPHATLLGAFGKALRAGVDAILLDLQALQEGERRTWVEHATKVASLRPPGSRQPLVGVLDAAMRCESVLMPETGSVYPHVLPTGAARVRMTPSDLGTPIDRWSRANRNALDKWARHVSDRSVGLALGGGGAWGYAHVALIEELTARQVPIDIVAGVSFGSMVGAYYCAAGAEGLNKLVAAGPRFAIAVQGAIFSSMVIGAQVKFDVGDHWLEDLDTVFLPVACDIAAAETTAIRGVNLALGTTASGSFPTVFGPTTAMDPVAGKLRRYVDGGISDNVPDGAILAEGADLVIASNIVPPPQAQPAPKPLFPGTLGLVLHALNPVQRLLDGYRSTFMLFHTAGNSEQLAVDASMHTTMSNYLPISFERARDIVAEAREAARATADHAALRWKAMQGRGFS